MSTFYKSNSCSRRLFPRFGVTAVLTILLLFYFALNDIENFKTNSNSKPTNSSSEMTNLISTTTTTPTVDHVAWFYSGGAMNVSLNLRYYRKLHLRLESLTAPNRSTKKERKEIDRLRIKVNKIERELYPWVKRFPSLIDMKHSFRGRGIVVSVARPYIPYVFTLLESLRIVNNTLPIIGYYCGKEELSEDERLLLAIRGLPTFDLYDTLDNTNINLQGYAKKPFVALVAPFRELIFVDADVIFLKNPEILFDHPVYQEKRTLLFRDRNVRHKPHGRVEFIAALIPKPYSKILKTSRILQKNFGHEEDACLYVIDKFERFCAMLAACKLCIEPLRTVVFKQCIGDKESQFLGSEMVGEPYGFSKNASGIIGDPVAFADSTGKINKMCGDSLYFDQNGEPMFTHGGFGNKHRPKSDWTQPEHNYTHWAPGDGQHDYDFCLTGSSKFFPVESDTLRRIQQLSRFWVDEKLGAMLANLKNQLTNKYS